MRAHMLSFLMYSAPTACSTDSHAWRRQQDDLSALEPAIADHVNRHFQADPACETTVVKRLDLKAKGLIRTFEASAHFHGHRLQADVTVTGTYDPATRTLTVKRLKERSVSRRGGTPVPSLGMAARQLLLRFRHS